MNGETFLAYVEQFLAPALSSGDIVTMDNLPSHKVNGVRDAIEARGATLLYLPPYSPDLNPIEQAFAKLKSILRTAAARSIEASWNRSARPSSGSHQMNAPTIFSTQAIHAQPDLLYVLRAGIAWTLLPKCFPTWPTAYRWFARFRDDGTWEAINHHLVMLDREHAGREATLRWYTVGFAEGTLTSSAGGSRDRQPERRDDRERWHPGVRRRQEDRGAQVTRHGRH